MIPPEFALVAGILLAFGLTVVLPGYKAFTWSFLIATFFMPTIHSNYPLELGIPYLSRDTVVAYGMLPATILFRPSSIRRLSRHHYLLLLLVVLAAIATLQAGGSMPLVLGASLQWLLRLVIPVCLAHWHFRTREQVLYFYRSALKLAAIYALLLIWEWRMSPQFHTIVYGHFQHQFLQMSRGGFFRPIGFFRHALDVGFLYAFLVVAAVGLHVNREFRAPRWLLVLLVLGAACSMSMGPILAAIIGLGLVWLRRNKTIGRLQKLLPIVILFAGIILTRDSRNFDPVVDLIRSVSEDRAASFQYRINACEEYLSAFSERPLFGYGPLQSFRTETATDSMLLIYLLVWGALATGVLYAWYYALLSCLATLASRPRRHGYDVFAAALFYGLSIAVVVDFVHHGTTPSITIFSMVVLGADPGGDTTGDSTEEIARPQPDPGLEDGRTADR